MSLLPLVSLPLAAEKPPEAVARPVEGAFVLDGQPREAFWATLPEYGPFHTLRERDAGALGPTRYRIAVRGDQLLVAVTSDQPGKSVQVVTRTPFSRAICKDDSFELFLTAGEKGPIHQFAVNAEGYPFSQQIPLDPHAPKPKGQPGPAWEVAVHRGETQWSAEFVIPLESLARSEGRWRLNVARTWGHWLIFQSWAPVTGGFAQWKRHGFLNFEPALKLPPPAPPAVKAGPWMTGVQHLGLEWENLPEGDYQLSYSLGPWEAGGLPERKVALQRLAPKGGRLAVKLPLELPYQAEPQELIMELSRGGERVALLRERIHMHRLLAAGLAQPVFYEEEGAINLPVKLNITPETPLHGKLRLTVTPLPEGTPWSKEVKLEGKTFHHFLIPSSILNAGSTYQTEIHADLGPYGNDRFEGGFYFVRGPHTP